MTFTQQRMSNNLSKDKLLNIIDSDIRFRWEPRNKIMPKTQLEESLEIENCKDSLDKW
jgi:hypothetical protein